MAADLLKVDLTKDTVIRKALPAEQEMLGGHALTSTIAAQKVDPKVDAVDAGNTLVFAAAVLGGTMVPNSGRLSVGAKSPLTGGIKEANSGGAAACKIARLGLRAIQVNGAADELSVHEVTAAGGNLVP